MAQTKGPLLSLSASGDIAGTLQYNHSRRRNIVRVKPPMPYVTSPGLLTARAHHASAIARYQQHLTDPLVRDAWKRHATYKRDNMSAYDEACKHMLLGFRTCANPAITSDLTGHEQYGLWWRTCGVTTWYDYDDVGNFECFAGPSPESMVHVGAGDYEEDGNFSIPLAAHTWPIFAQIVKDGVPRSGIHRLDLPPLLWSIVEAWVHGVKTHTHVLQSTLPWNGWPVWKKIGEDTYIWNDAHYPSSHWYRTVAPGNFTGNVYRPEDYVTLISPWVDDATGLYAYDMVGVP